MLSIAQEVEIGATAVASANMQPLKVLEPVDDTVERVADAAFWVSLVAGALAISIGPVSSLGFILLAVGLFVTSCRPVLERRLGGYHSGVCRAGTLCNISGMALAILLPVALATGGSLAEVLTRSDWAEANSVLMEMSDHASELLPVSPGAEVGTDTTDDTGWWQWLSSSGQGTRDVLSGASAYWSAAEYYLTNADDLLEASLKIVAIFLLRALILPGAMLFVLLGIVRRLFATA